MPGRDGSNRHVFDDSQPITPAKFEPGEIVALWRHNHAVFVEYIASAGGKNWRTGKPYRRSLVKILPGGEEKLVQNHALAKLTDLQQQEYIMAKLEDRTDMTIKET